MRGGHHPVGAPSSGPEGSPPRGVVTLPVPGRRQDLNAQSRPGSAVSTSAAPAGRIMPGFLHPPLGAVVRFTVIAGLDFSCAGLRDLSTSASRALYAGVLSWCCRGRVAGSRSLLTTPLPRGRPATPMAADGALGTVRLAPPPFSPVPRARVSPKRLGAAGRRAPERRPRPSGPTSGSRILAVVPTPFTDSMEVSPPILSTSSLQIASPSPKPPPVSPSPR